MCCREEEKAAILYQLQCGKSKHFTFCCHVTSDEKYISPIS